MKPDPRRTAEAVRLVRTVWPDAYQELRRIFNGEREYVVHKYEQENGEPHYNTYLSCGSTPKEAWWNAVPKALAKALTS